MRIFGILGIVAALFMVCTPVYAAHEEGGGYVGIAANYAIPNFDTDDVGGISLDFDNTWGVEAQGGYHFNQYISAGLALDYLADFEFEDTLWGVNVKEEVSVTTLMADFRVSPGLTTKNLDVYILGGLGWMWGEAEATATQGAAFVKVKEDHSDLCGQLGLGLEIFPEGAVSVILDGKYVWGFSDMDEIQYSNISLGVRYNF